MAAKGIGKIHALFGQPEQYRRSSGGAITPISGLKMGGCPLREGPHRSLYTPSKKAVFSPYSLFSPRAGMEIAGPWSFKTLSGN